MSTDSELLRLTAAWMEYVGRDHHKDRDCHWYIECDYAYGDAPEFTVSHQGYIGLDEARPADSYEHAKDVLLRMIRDAIREEKAWASRVLSDPAEWESFDIESANLITEIQEDK